MQRDGAVRVSDLVEELGVSEMTVRRDIAELASRGLVRKVHGGAVGSGATAHEPGFAAKASLAPAEKRAIAVAAAELIRQGDSVALSAGTTTALLAAHIRSREDLRPLTVVTNSLPVADTLFPAQGVEVILTGGTRTRSDALVGPIAVSVLEQLRVDALFLGVHALDPRAGLTTPNVFEAETDRALAAAAGRVIVLADSSKWGTVGLSRILPLDGVDVLVTDDGMAPEDVEVAQECVGRLIVATATERPGGEA